MTRGDARFDGRAGPLCTARSRHRALGCLLAGTLRVLSGGSDDEAAAHDLKAKCKKKSGEAKKKCLKKAKKHAAAHANETQPPPPPPPRPHVCAGRNLCTTPGEENLCQTSGQECECAVTAAGAPFCAATRPRGYPVATCGACGEGETCIDLAACEGAPAPFGCVSPCPNGPACNDGLKNGSETDIDCGGSCPGCAPGKTCVRNADCASGRCACVSGSCTCREANCQPDRQVCELDKDCCEGYCF